jgi:hypothetical protein
MSSRRADLVTPGVAAVLFLALGSLAPPGSAAAEAKNQCEECHSNPDFLVQNRQLYDYYQEWSVSIHRQEDVSCEDCHGGNSETSNKDKAHGDGVSASDPSSGIYYKNVPDTCGTCHEEILEGFRTSDHFEQVAAKKDEQQGPTCITCHGSIDSEILNVNTVSDACARCHNAESDNHPDNPEKARAILHRFLSIHRFYRYIAIRAEPDEARAFFEKIDPRMTQLSVTWHTFDLDEIDAGTADMLTEMKAKRDEIRTRRAEAKAKAKAE